MNGNYERWAEIPADVDVALLQEAIKPRDNVEYRVVAAIEESWQTAGWSASSNFWRRSTAIAAPSGRYELRPYRLQSFDEQGATALAVGRSGMLAVADVLLDGQRLLTVASVYGFWQKSYDGRVEYADASVHAALSELSPLLSGPEDHRLIVAGDLNILYGYGEGGSADSEYWSSRYRSVFQRAEVMGLQYCGPQAPNGRVADPRPDELPHDSRCVPTYRTSHGSPETAYRQLDHVLVSTSIASKVSTRALNGIAEWGKSDHCRIEIELDI
jgi:endonuclease/exonuclease/phosphatase family metal-dependent hydrolase